MAEFKQLSSLGNEGIKVDIKDDLIYFDIYIIISSHQNARLVAQTIQRRLNRAITDMVGMEIAKINVHITDVDIEA
jgi:uncharacterized alkaline shock family protein YloU